MTQTLNQLAKWAASFAKILSQTDLETLNTLNSGSL